MQDQALRVIQDQEDVMRGRDSVSPTISADSLGAPGLKLHGLRGKKNRGCSALTSHSCSVETADQQFGSWRRCSGEGAKQRAAGGLWGRGQSGGGKRWAEGWALGDALEQGREEVERMECQGRGWGEAERG